MVGEESIFSSHTWRQFLCTTGKVNLIERCNVNELCSAVSLMMLLIRRYDYVTVYVGRRLVRHLTGKGSHKDKVTHVQGTGELISIVFRSDRSVTRRGFFAKYSTTHGIIFLL